MEVVAEAQRLEAQGMDVIHLEIGEPDFQTPQPVIACAQGALADGMTRYTDARGIAPLRQAIADWYRDHGIMMGPERIQITQGASAALLLALAAALNPGDGVLMADPLYPCNPRIVESVGGRVHRLPTSAESAFHPTASQLMQAAGPDDALLMLAHPANPTGLAVPVLEMQAMIAWCQRTRRHLLVDEIYQPIGFSPIRSSLHDADQHFVTGSFSKLFNMTGWRLGWLVMPEFAIEATTRLAQHLFICPSSLAQAAAVQCFSPEVLAEASARVDDLKARRDYLVSALVSLGFGLPSVPEGAFYLFLDASKFTDNTEQLCLDLVRKTGVAITPGVDFSTLLPPTWVRIAYTQPIERLAEAVSRMQAYFDAGL